jgi:hypothetical protein
MDINEEKIEFLIRLIEHSNPSLLRPDGYKKKLMGYARNYHFYKAVLECFVNKDITKAKQEFFQYGLSSILYIEKIDSKHLRWNSYLPYYVLLSDARELMDQFGRLSYPQFEKDVAKGDGQIFINIMQQFMINDKEGIAKNLLILEEKMVPKKNRKSELPIYFFLKSLLKGDKDDIVSRLNMYVSDKHIKRIMKHDDIMNAFTLYPALGLTKLAWHQGMEIELNSPYIPMEIMPIKPNDSYVDAYPFLWDMEKEEILEFEL